MAASLKFDLRLFRSSQFHAKSLSKHYSTSLSVRCSATSQARRYSITLLPGDGIGPEVIFVAKNVLNLTGSLEGIVFDFKEMPVGGAALDLTGVPLPEQTLLAVKPSDAVLLGAIGGYKWDNNEKHLKPETGLLQLREGLKVIANLRPAFVLPQLIDASTLKKEVAEGVDLMVVRELTGGQKPRGFGTNKNGGEIGFNTEVYATYEIDLIARIAFEAARKRCGKLCSIDKANVLEASMLWRKRVTVIASEYPLATVLSAAMLLRYGLGEEKAARRIETAVLDTLVGVSEPVTYTRKEKSVDFRHFSAFYFPH